MKNRLFLSALFLSLGSPFGWGPVGHQVVATIAEDYLSPAAKEKISRLFGGKIDLAGMSVWADRMRSSDSTTEPWHFIDIDVRKSPKRSDEGKFCSVKSCVTEQIDRDIAILKDKAKSAEAQIVALKYLIHFIGDIHQPLHCADDSDRGGNDKIVLYREPGAKKETRVSLHALWDRLIEIKTEENPGMLAQQLEKNISEQDKKRWRAGKPAEWAWESYLIARDSIYPDFQPGPSSARGTPLPPKYYSGAMRKIVDRQLCKAGIRLAFVLENIFGK